MSVIVTSNPDARRATLLTAADTPADEVGRALDGLFLSPDFRPGLRIMEVVRGPAGPGVVTRAVKALSLRARRLALRRWAVVVDGTDDLPARTWTGIAGPAVVRVAVFTSVPAALDWLDADGADAPDPVPEPAAPAAPSPFARRGKFSSPSATGFHPAPTLLRPKPGGPDATPGVDPRS